MPVHICVHVCGDQRLMSSAFLNHSPHYLLNHWISLNPELTNSAGLAGQRAPVILLSNLSNTGITARTLLELQPGICMWVLEIKPRSPACMVITSLTKAPPLPTFYN